MKLRLGLAFVALIFSSVPTRAGVLIIAANGTGQYTEIQPAINAALDGDTLLVKAGTYQSFVISNKELGVVADTGAIVDVDGAIRVRGLSADRTVNIAGLRATGSTTNNEFSANGMYLKNNSGSVRVQACTLKGVLMNCMLHHGADIDSCSDVAFVRCTIEGSDEFKGGNGIEVLASNLALYDCTVRGGHGGTDIGCPDVPGGYGYGDGRPGGEGLNGQSSFIFASHNSFTGGDAGTPLDMGGYCTMGALGGIGLQAIQCETQLLDNAYDGGDSSFSYTPPGTCWCCGTGANIHIPTFFAQGTHTFISGLSRTLSAISPMRELATTTLQFLGSPGDSAFLYIAGDTRFVFSAPFRGVKLTGPQPGKMLILGQVGANGALNYPITIPELGPGVQSTTFFMQSLHRDSTGQMTLGSPFTLVALDQAF